MTAREWARIAAVMQARWHSEVLAPSTLAQYGKDLEDMPARHVEIALDTLARDGARFAPKAGEVRRRIFELWLAPPDWPTVMAETRRCLARGERVYREGRFTDERAARLELCHPLIRLFVRIVGWPIVDDTTSEAQWRTKWERFLERRLRDEAYAGLPAVPAMKRVGGGLRQLDAGSAIEGPA